MSRSTNLGSTFNINILNKKNVTSGLKYVSSECERFFCKFYFMYSLVFTVLKMSITTEASKFMSKEQFDVRKDPNLKID